MNKFLLVGDKFMPEMHLKQPGFTYSACGPFTKNKERLENFMQTGNKDFIYRNELDKVCFQHSMAYGKSNDLAKTTQSDKVLKDKAFKIVSARKYDGYERGLVKNLVEQAMSMNQIISSQMSFMNQLLKKLRKEKFIHISNIIFGALI